MNISSEAIASPLIQLFHGELYRRLEEFTLPAGVERSLHPVQQPISNQRKMVKFPPGNHILFPNHVWEDQLLPAAV